MLVSYLDAAVDRVRRRSSAEFESLVEGTRAGTIFAHDKKAYGKWIRGKPKRTGQRERGLTGAALEAAVMQVAQQFPGNVVRVAA